MLKRYFVLLAGVLSCLSTVHAQPTIPSKNGSSPAIALHESSRKSIVSEVGGAFMFPARCDADGNLYIRKYATDRPLLGPIVKIDPEGKRVAFFDPKAFSDVKPDRADAFSPAPDGAFYQIAGGGIAGSPVYVLKFSSDGSPSSRVILAADFKPYQFAPFADGNFLASGFVSDPQGRPEKARAFNAVFSADGRLLKEISFGRAIDVEATASSTKHREGSALKPPLPTLDLSDSEAGVDGNIYALRHSSPALVYVISPGG